MEDSLCEQIPRGTILYPFALYRMVSGREHFFISCHWHKEIEVIFIMKGSLSIMVNEEKFIGNAGDIFFIGQEKLHGMSILGKWVSYNAMVFQMEFLNFEMFDYVQSCYLNPLCHKKMCFPTKIPHNIEHYKNAWDELIAIAELDNERKSGYQIAIKASLLKFISYLIMDGLLYQSDLGENKSTDFKMENLKAILAYIKRHYSEKLYLSGIASEFSLSEKYFSRYFKKNLGRSFVEYLNSFRIEKAAGLLKSTDMPIGEISLSVGFDNFSYFIKQFKKIHNCTPSYYRKNDKLPEMQ